MRELGDINSKFRQFFHCDGVFNENWPRNLTLSEKIEQYEQCFCIVTQLEINDEWNFPDPNTFPRMVYRGLNVNFSPPPRVRRALSVRPCSPIPGPSNGTVPDPGTMIVTDSRNQVDYPNLDDSNTDERSLLIRALYRAEILSIQLNNVLGRPNYPPPMINAGDYNTGRGILTRYNHLFDTMNERESELPILNSDPSDDIDHTSLISPQFGMGLSVQNDQIDQSGQIDLSGSQIDLNSNIQINYPETSATWDDTENENEGVSHFSGNGNDETGNEETGNVTEARAVGQALITQQLASSGIDSYALTYSDGSAHFQGSALETTFDLSAPEEPIDGANSTIESYEDYDGAQRNPEMDLPFHFEN